MPIFDSNFDPKARNAEVESKLRNIGARIGTSLPSGFGFTLLIYSFGPDGSMFYISNAERTSMIEAMQEFISKQKVK